jgi:hypothetical protein
MDFEQPLSNLEKQLVRNRADFKEARAREKTADWAHPNLWDTPQEAVKPGGLEDEPDAQNATRFRYLNRTRTVLGGLGRVRLFEVAA